MTPTPTVSENLDERSGPTGHGHHIQQSPLFIEASAKTAVGVEAAFCNSRILDTPGLLQSNAGPNSVDVSMEPDEAHNSEWKLLLS